MIDLTKHKIGVLAGGPSSEKQISLISGKAVYDALCTKNLDCRFIEVEDDWLDVLRREKITFCFLALHGEFGEDGTVQSALDTEGLSYSGANAQVSRNAFDKTITQKIFQAAGVLLPEFRILTKETKHALDFKPPFVVKPACCGSSIGLTIVRNEGETAQALDLAFKYGNSVLVDRYIQGRELTVGFLGDHVLPVVEVIPARDFYDYEAKYGESGTRYEVPANLTPELARRVQAEAAKAYRAIGCEIMGRVDVILDASEKPFVLEINTIPGLTGKSLLPKAAKAAGIEFPDLCVKIIEVSLSRASKRSLNAKTR